MSRLAKVAFVRGLTCVLLLACVACVDPFAPRKDGAGASGYPAPVGASFRDLPSAPELVVIPAGHYIMGGTESEALHEGRAAESAAWERPPHEVNVAAPLAVGKYLVTRKEYGEFITASGRAQERGCMVLDGSWHTEPARSFTDPAFAQGDLDPAVCVNAADAAAYASWLSETSHHHYRLLHEAEWEYAARAGSTGSRWWGGGRADICAHANGADVSFHAAYPDDAHANLDCEDGFAHTNPGTRFPANPFGLHDMLGNVWEWTADCFVAGYEHAAADAAAEVGAAGCARRSIRGGSWHNSPDSLRSAARYWLPVEMRSSSLGFRVVRLADGRS